MYRITIGLTLLFLVGCGGASSEVAAVHQDQDSGSTPEATTDGDTLDSGILQDSGTPDTRKEIDSGTGPETSTDSGLEASPSEGGPIEASLTDTYVAETSMQDTYVPETGVPETGIFDSGIPEASVDASEAGQDAGSSGCGSVCPASQCTQMPAPYASFCNFCNEFGYVGGPPGYWWCGSEISYNYGADPMPAANANLIFGCFGTMGNRVPGVEQELVDGSVTPLCSGLGQACHEQTVDGGRVVWCQ